MLESIPTKGRTLDHAAHVYDLVEPLILLGKEKTINENLIRLLTLRTTDKILDVGCGTGVLTGMISKNLDAGKAGLVTGIDAAAKMIEGARKKRESTTCRFEVAAAENLPFEDNTFDSAISTLFFHHVDLNLKQKTLSEIWRVLKPGGRLVISDMHQPTTFMGKLVSHVSRWLLFQPEIGENIRGVLPPLIEMAGFDPPMLHAMYFGYIAVFSSQKPVRS